LAQAVTAGFIDAEGNARQNSLILCYFWFVATDLYGVSSSCRPGRST